MSTAGWELLHEVDLQPCNTLGVPARASRLLLVHDGGQIDQALADPAVAGQPLLPIGGGSNLLLVTDPQVLVLKITDARVAIIEHRADHAIVRAAAGMGWHDLVMWTLGHGLCGLENLALIPGTVGAAPIQNIGAYGVEVRERIRAVHAFDRRDSSVVRIDAGDCAFAYRDSLFKHDPDRYVVTAVEFTLPRTPALRLDYAGIGEELRAMGIDAAPRASQVAEAVIRIRQRKLPDPALLGNAGSFFKNPIVPAAIAEALQSAHPAMPLFRGSSDDTRKLSAAWLIDLCGWKGHRDGDAGVSAEHALVLVNHGHASGLQLLDLARRIAASVHARFGIDIEPEPRIIGATW